jgi:sigma-B regulation protein RsbU (phosphoserine phosphatase)
MNEFFLLSFAFIIVFCAPLWLSAAKRKEYGPRSALLLLSLLSFLAIGAYSFVAIVAAGDAGIPFPALLTIQVLYAPAFFLLEYSVHAQRIRKNLLVKEFKAKLSRVLVVFILTALACAATWLLYGLVIDQGAENRSLPFLMKLLSASLLIAAYMVSNHAFDLEEGIIRRTSYTFTSGSVATGAAFLAAAVFPSLPQPILAICFGLNAVFAIRLFHEYFVYRMGHVNDIHRQQIEFEHSRTDLLNQVLFSTPEEDTKLIGDTLRASFVQLQQCFSKSNLVFRSMMAYRRAGDLLVVDEDAFILEYCMPLMDVERIGQMRSDVVHAQIKAQAFDLAKILGAEAGAADGLDFAEAAIRRMVETKGPVAVESLPASLARSFKLILLRPIFNQDDLRGMLVLFKTDNDYVFPQEDVILSSLTRNLSLILTMIDGKKVQDEKNRLNREMDIAKNIQTSILPRAFELAGYEAESQMITASEVGGDLYDFVPTKFGGYLDIADVAGHGLPAGIAALIHMAALHAALRTSESLGRELDVAELYDIVNKVMVEVNRDRIGSDKFMTCNILSERGGAMDYAGSHLIGLVYRAESGQVEEIGGMQGKAAFLGISELATSSGSKGRIVMSSGDLFLLYTDGLIEARDMNGNFFGVDGLKEVLSQSAKAPLEEAKRAILERLKSFAEAGDRKKYDGSYADDVSLVLIRRK